MEKLIVTGSCGFIGYNFIKSNSSKYQIIGIDSLNEAYDSRLKKMRLKSLQEDANFSFKKINLSNNVEVNKESELFDNVKAVVHLAAPARAAR